MDKTIGTPAANKTLSKMHDACKEMTGVSNVWHERGSDFVLEVSSRANADGAITGQIIRMDTPTLEGKRPSSVVGTIRIEPNGIVTRAHRFLMEAAQKAREARQVEAAKVTKTVEEVKAAPITKVKPKKLDPKWYDAAVKRAAHAREVKFARLASAKEKPQLTEQQQRMAHARKVRLDRLRELRNKQAA